MGKQFALDLASSDLPLDIQVEQHLAFNCYPLPPSYMAPVCVQAIQLVNDGKPDEAVELPPGVLYHGGDSVSARQVVKSFRLEAWIN